ncbi:MAG TPA: hypothetical protein VGF59_15670 [Bryobacteraceae bacterium]|jgi:heme-degrading monooxygenase HmoA
MKAVEFDSTITPSGDLAVLAEIARELPAGERVRVLVLWETADADAAWRAAAMDRFAAAYAPEDEIYERLIDDSPVG